MIKIVFAHAYDCTHVLFVLGPQEADQFDFLMWAGSRKEQLSFLKTTVSCREYKV